MLAFETHRPRTAKGGVGYRCCCCSCKLNVTQVAPLLTPTYNEVTSHGSIVPKAVVSGNTYSFVGITHSPTHVKGLTCQYCFSETTAVHSSTQRQLVPPADQTQSKHHAHHSLRAALTACPQEGRLLLDGTNAWQGDKAQNHAHSACTGTAVFMCKMCGETPQLHTRRAVRHTRAV